MGSSSVEAAFDDWREEVENRVRDYIELSVACEDDILDREMDSAEISNYHRSMRVNTVEQGTNIIDLECIIVVCLSLGP